MWTTPARGWSSWPTPSARFPPSDAFAYPDDFEYSGNDANTPISEFKELVQGTVWALFIDENEDDPGIDELRLKVAKDELVKFFASDDMLWWRYEADESLDERIASFYRQANKLNIAGDMTKASERSKMALRLEGVKTRKIQVVQEKKRALSEAEMRDHHLRTDTFPQYRLYTYDITDKKGKVHMKVGMNETSFRL